VRRRSSRSNRKKRRSTFPRAQAGRFAMSNSRSAIWSPWAVSSPCWMLRFRPRLPPPHRRPTRPRGEPLRHRHPPAHRCRKRKRRARRPKRCARTASYTRVRRSGASHVSSASICMGCAVAGPMRASPAKTCKASCVPRSARRRRRTRSRAACRSIYRRGRTSMLGGSDRSRSCRSRASAKFRDRTCIAIGSRSRTLPITTKPISRTSKHFANDSTPNRPAQR